MRAGGPLRDRERRRDLLVAAASAQKAKHFELALRQRLDGFRLRLLLAEPLGEQAGYGGIEMDLAVVRRPHSRRDLVGLGILQEVARRARFERRRDLLLLDER